MLVIAKDLKPGDVLENGETVDCTETTPIAPSEIVVYCTNGNYYFYPLGKCLGITRPIT